MERANIPVNYYFASEIDKCERLQTLPDGYTSGISNTQRYKCIGNGWTVDVIKHIFEEMKKDKDYAPNFNL